MHCESYRTLLDAYLDGTLPKEQRSAMEAHLKSCPHCQMLLQVRSDLHTLNAEESMPADFPFAWRRQIRQEKKRMPAALKNALATAAAMLFLLGGTALHRQTPEVPMDSTPLMMRSMPAETAAGAIAANSGLTDFIQDMGAFLLDALPYIGIAVAVMMLGLILKKYKAKRKD